MTINILSNLVHPIFKGFSLSELEHILKIAKIRTFAIGEELIHEGDESQTIYVILSGTVDVTRESDIKGKPICLASLGPNQVIGEISVLTSKPRSATVKAHTETVALMVDATEIEKNPATNYLYNKLRTNLTEELSNKLVYFHDKVIKSEDVEEGCRLEEGLPFYKPSTILSFFGWKWQDILHEVPFLASQGYDAIKISPPQEFVIRKGRPWWEIYQPVSYNLSQFYGTEDDFKAMIDLCHTFEIKVYADLVLNHMACYAEEESQHVGTNGTTFTKYHYGPLNSNQDFYDFDDFYHLTPEGNLQTAPEDYGKFERIWHLEHYDLLKLPKLNIEKTHVLAIEKRYVQYLLDYGIDGFRIDAAKHLNIPSVEKIFANMVTNDGLKPFLYQEYYVGGLPVGIDTYSYMEKYFKIGYVTAFNYGDFLSDAINNKNNNLEKLVSFNFGSSWIHYPENRAVVVLDNHDTERMMPSILNFRCTKNNAYVLAYIFMFAWPFGIPKVMSSFRFNNQDDPIPNTPVWQNGRNTCFDPGSPWVCQHRWNAIANMVLLRKKTEQAEGVSHIWAEGNQVAFARSYQKPGEYVASLAFIVINATAKPLRRRFDTGLVAGKYIDLITGYLKDGEMQGQTIQVKDYGFAEIEVKPYDAVAIGIDFKET